MQIPKQTRADRRNEIIRIKQNIKAVKSSGHFSKKDQAELLPFYESRLKALEDLETKEITVNNPQLVK